MGAELSPGHDPDHVEDLQGEDDDGRPHGDNRALAVGYNDAEENLHLVGTIHPACLQQFFGDAFEGRRKEHHGEASLQPDDDQDQEQVVPGCDGHPFVPGMGVAAQGHDDAV